MQTVWDPRCDSRNDTVNPREIENRIHHEFWTAYAAWEDAPEYRKAEAASRLKRSVHQLYDFVVRGKVPQRMLTFRAASSAP